MTVQACKEPGALAATAAVTSPRQRFLKTKRKQSLQQYAIALYLVALMTILLGLQTTVGDSLLYSLFAYIITSSFVVLVCVTQSRCCSAHRTVYRPIPPCIVHQHSHNSPPSQSSKDLECFCTTKDQQQQHASVATSDVIFVIHDGCTSATTSPDNLHHHSSSFAHPQFALTPAASKNNLLTSCRS